MSGESRYGDKVSRRLNGACPPQEPDEVPQGHSVPAHVLVGWCAACRGKITSDELAMWRQFGKRYLPLLRAATRGSEPGA